MINMIRFSFYPRYFILAAFACLFFSCSNTEKRSYDEQGRLLSVLRYDKEGRMQGMWEWYYPRGI